MPIAVFALRPFDSTDADVAPLHAVEVEFGPLGYLKSGADRYLVVPALVLNYGLAPRVEMVGEGEILHGFDGTPDALTDAEVSLKQVLREGSLQDRSGPSVAAEYGLLLPEGNGDNGVGASLAGIVSQQWRFGTLHLNALVASTRTHHLDLFGGSIFEGPPRWTFRPVAEVFVERERAVPRTLSGLGGVIWQRSEQLSFDFALRYARQSGNDQRELRAGVTWSLPGG